MSLAEARFQPSNREPPQSALSKGNSELRTLKIRRINSGMRYAQIRNVLDEARDFHGQLAEYYGQLSDNAIQQRVALLLDHMSSHEKALQRGLAAYEDDAERQVMDTWVDLSRHEEILATFKKTLIAADTSVDNVTRAAMDVDHCLLRFYRDVAGSAESETVREVFSNLIDMEEAELRKLAFGALQATDI